MCNTHTPVIPDDEIQRIGEDYQILINPNDATQYKLCQIILMLEQQNNPETAQ